MGGGGKRMIDRSRQREKKNSIHNFKDLNN